MYWRYLSKKHFIGIVECFSKFFILHRERSLLYKLFWCFCPRKIALLRNWCQIRFLLSLSTKVWILYFVMYLLMRWWKNYFWRYFFKKFIFTKFYPSWKACIWNRIFIDKISFFRKSFFCIPTAQHSSLIMRLLIIGKFLKCLAPQT